MEGDVVIWAKGGNDYACEGLGNDVIGGDNGDYYNCRPGFDTIYGYDPGSGDAKTAECEKWLEKEKRGSWLGSLSRLS